MSPEECIDKLEQLIFDENQLVTYKLLSKELQIHVNEAKKYLYDFLTIHKSKEDVNLYAYFFVAGIIVKDGEQSRKIAVVSEDKLEQVKNDFKEVTSCHIYSLNKGEHRNESALYNSQSWCKKWAEEHKEYSAIKHPNILIQDPVIKAVEKKKSDTNLVSSKTPIIKQVKNEGISSLFQKNKTKDTEHVTLMSAGNKQKSEDEVTKASDNNTTQANLSSMAISNSEPKDNKKSTLSSLWQKLEDKSKNTKNGNSKADSKGKNKSQVSGKNVGKNNIMSMFSKQAEKNAVNPVKKTTNNSVSSKQDVSATENVSTNNVSLNVEKGIVTKKVSAENGKRKSSQRKSKRTSKQAIGDESDEEIKPMKKKHRRICTMDDTDSESESEEAQDKAQRSLLASEEPNDTAMVLSDSEEPIPPTPPVISNKGKSKVWKTVQKTFEDEDGFFVTKQEKVLVSASDSDEDPLTSKSPSKAEPKQNTFMYRKQASLTSFFKQQ